MANRRNTGNEANVSPAGGPDAGESAVNPRKFEEELGNLDDIVAQIDSGELSLEESISAFERGVALVRSLNQKLDEVERRVEVLMRTEHGELKTTAYQEELGGKENGGENGGAEDDDAPF